MVTEYVPGPDLAKLTAGRPAAGGPLVPWEDACRYLEHAADGLVGVHAAGLWHGDVTPRNLIWNPTTASVVVVDFGLAARSHGRRGGTPGYRAPDPVAGPAGDRVGLAAVGWVAARPLGWPTPVRTPGDAATVLGVAVACATTAFVNPYGLDLLRTWRIIMGEPALQQIIQEHSALDPTAAYAWPVLGLALLYGFLLAGVPIRQLRVSWLLPLVWLVLTFDRVRHAPLFAVAGLVGVAAVWPHTRWAAWLARHRPDFYPLPGADAPTPLAANLWLPVLAVATALLLQVNRVPVPLVGSGWAVHDPRHWPVELLDVLKANEPHGTAGNRLFNDYLDGGFVIYHAPGYKVFVDDRCEVFGGDWLLAFVRAGSEDTAGAVGKWERDYGRFDFALTRTGTGFDRHFAAAPGWECAKRTETASFYKRR